MVKKITHKDSVDYWKSFTDEKNTDNHISFVPKNDVVNVYIDELGIEVGAQVLDAGTGFGRLVPIIRKYSDNVHVLDYDAKMLESLHATFGSEIKTYTNASIENSGYQDQSFDYLICWGVFDELSQEAALAEFSRILKVGGKMLITGKNCKYDCSDTEAIAAEEAARRLGHKNLFTRFNEIDFESYGLAQKSTSKFKKRGDFAKNKLCNSDDEEFYEFCTILEKIKNFDKIDEKYASHIGFSVSDTWFETKLDITRRNDFVSKPAFKNIFLSGVYRSGTTILSQIIGAHPDIFMSYDTIKYLRFCIQNENNRSLDDLTDETLLRLQSRWKVNLTRESLCNKDNELPKTHADLYSKILQQMAKQYKPEATIFGEKNVLCWKQAPNFFSMFPHGKLIHVVRDPRDVAASYKKITYEPGLAYLDSAFNCLHSHYSLLSYIQNFGENRVLFLKFEDLAENPLRICYRICDFLGLSFSQDMMDPNNYKDRVGNTWKNNSAFFENSSGIFTDQHRWSKILSEEETLFIESVTMPVLNYWGYKKSGYDAEKLSNIIKDVFNDPVLNNGYREYMRNGVGREGYPSDPIEKEMNIASER